MMNFSRQRDIMDPAEFVWPVHCVGVGGIGSANALVLAKLGVLELHLWDPDTVAEENIPNQLIYEPTDVGKHKVDAAAETLRRMTGVTVHVHPEFCTPTTRLEGVVVSGVHSMQARQDIWKAVKQNALVPLYLDGRLGGEICELHTVRPSNLDDGETYEKFLFPDAEAAALPCAARAIIHPPAILAGIVASQLIRWIRKERYYRRIVFDAKTMTLLTQFERKGGA
ncbi:ThiF family adenylyltransferase [Candidatus Uhrbacteria bacterium]|nr:ThiF family adenylyltransferase [Candidatus Uhrbacteria bacterium]